MVTAKRCEQSLTLCRGAILVILIVLACKHCLFLLCLLLADHVGFCAWLMASGQQSEISCHHQAAYVPGWLSCDIEVHHVTCRQPSTLYLSAAPLAWRQSSLTCLSACSHMQRWHCDLIAISIAMGTIASDFSQIECPKNAKRIAICVVITKRWRL